MHHGAVTRPNGRRPQPSVGLESVGNHHIGVGHLPQGLNFLGGDLEGDIWLAHGPQTGRGRHGFQRIHSSLARRTRI